MALGFSVLLGSSLPSVVKIFWCSIYCSASALVHSKAKPSLVKRTEPDIGHSGLRSHTVVWSARHDVSSPADAAKRAIRVHAASVHTRELHADAVLTLVFICRHTHTPT